MSTIIEFIITYVITFLLSLAVGLPIVYIESRKLDKHISNKMSTFRESRAALDENQDESRAQVDEINESADRISESLNEIGESLDRMNERLDRTIEFKRLFSEYLDNKIKRIEARENFCESQFWDEKNIH